MSILTILLIAYLSLFKPPKTQLDEISYFDKVVHMGMYLFLSSLLWIEFFRAHRHDGTPLWHAWIGALVCPVVYGGVIELLQAYATLYRSGDWEDFVANTVGVIIGSLLCYGVVRKRWFSS